jgi:hypothetical protein
MTSEAGERSAATWTLWPRLYLDAAEILRIADGNADPNAVQELSRAMWSRCVLLVISIEHLQDALPRAGADAPNRVAEALERFQLRSVVVRSPADIEPWQDSSADIEIAPAANVREVLTVGVKHQVLHDLSWLQDTLHATSVEFQKAQLAAQGTTLTSSEHKLAFQCLVTVVRGWLGTNVEEVIAHWEAKDGVALLPRVKVALRAQLQPFGDLMNVVGKDPRLDDDARMKILMMMRDSFGDDSYIHAPGMFLAARVATCRMRNQTRVPTLTDSVDAMHATYFPYVDIATCDRQTYACLAPHLSKITRPRSPMVFRNGRLEAVLRAVCAFPVLASS